MASKFEVSTIFTAIDKMTAPISRMQKSVRGLTSSAGRGLKVFNGIGSKITDAVGLAGVVSFAGLTTAITKAIKTGMEFDQVMVKAAAKLDVKKGTKQFEDLNKVVMELGSRTEFSASDVAKALDAMAAAGFDAKQSMAGLAGVLDLATAADVNLDQATQMAADSLGAFSLVTPDSDKLVKNLERVSDVMAMTANITTTSMEDIYSTFRKAGPVGTMAGASLETIGAMTGLMSSVAKAEVAGTSIANFFLQLQNPKGATAKTIRALGINLKNKKGGLKDVPDLLDEINSKIKKLSPTARAAAIENLFGREGLAGNTKLLEMGGEALRKLRIELEKAGGYSKVLAKETRNTLKGSVNSLTSSIENMSIELFKTTEGPLKEIVDGMTAWVRENGKLKAQQMGTFLIDTYNAFVKYKKAAYYIGMVTAAMWALSVAVGVVNVLVTTNPIVLAITAIVLALGWLSITIYSSWDDIKKFFSDVSGGLRDLSHNIIDTLGDAFKAVTGIDAKPFLDKVKIFFDVTIMVFKIAFTNIYNWIVEKIDMLINKITLGFGSLFGPDTQAGNDIAADMSGYGLPPLIAPRYNLVTDGGNPVSGNPDVNVNLNVNTDNPDTKVTAAGPQSPGVKVKNTGGFNQ